MAAFTVGLKVTPVSIDSARQSFDSVLAAVDALSPEALESLHGGPFRSIILGEDDGDLVVIEDFDLPATGATILRGFKVLPGKRYLEFVSSIVANGNANVSFDADGWPILSVVSGITTVAEAGGGANPSGGGPAE